MPKARKLIEQEANDNKDSVVAVMAHEPGVIYGYDLADLQKQALEYGRIQSPEQLEQRFTIFSTDGTSLFASGKIQRVGTKQFDAAVEFLGVPEIREVLVRDAGGKVIAKSIESFLRERQQYAPIRVDSEQEQKESKAKAEREKNFYIGLHMVQRGRDMVVKSVDDGSPAAKSGLAPYDEIVRVGDYPVESIKGYEALAHLIEIGKEVKIWLIRDGTKYKTRITPVNVKSLSATPDDSWADLDAKLPAPPLPRISLSPQVQPTPAAPIRYKVPSPPSKPESPKEKPHWSANSWSPETD